MLTKGMIATSLAFVLGSVAWGQQARPARFVTVEGPKFVDPEGRHLLLHGSTSSTRAPIGANTAGSTSPVTPR